MIIREYRDEDNLQWVRCRVLSFLDSAYFDNVLREKESYSNPSIELVAEVDNKIIGFIDIEYERKIGEVCHKTNELGGVIWHLGVLPEYRKLGVGSLLLSEAINGIKGTGVKRLQAWTRDDKWVNDWYKDRGFIWKESYLHVYAEDVECDKAVQPMINKLYVCGTFSHYIGEDKEFIKNSFKRVHECNLYELYIDG
ncbi:GNAT family N-acetyltransferase [Alloiococcus sp. CFN-8]|uniref:GNAT family N-acetyltransferase n=1 Tax=Alloiococcus sp. CFN-8 TaxID=3416081 RepID=UPI003CF68E7E